VIDGGWVAPLILGAKENSTWTLRFCRVKYRELDRRLLKRSGIPDRIPSINRFSLVTRHSHCGAARHPGALKIADRSATEIVDQPARNSSLLTSLRLRTSEILDTPTIEVDKNPGNYARSFSFTNLDNSPLSLKHFEQFKSKGEFSSSAVLALARIEPYPAIREIQVAPLTG
jgi:hypothetical protein